VAELSELGAPEREVKASLPLDWPMFKSNNVFAEYMVVKPFHALVMLRDPRFEGRRFIEPHLIFWLTTAVCCCVMAVHFAISIFYVIVMAVMISQDLVEGETWEDRVKDYHTENAPRLSPLMAGSSRSAAATTYDGRQPNQELARTVALTPADLEITVEVPQAVKPAGEIVSTRKVSMMPTLASGTLPVEPARSRASDLVSSVESITAYAEETNPGEGDEDIDQVLSRYR
jgi:hypothetical protein